MKEKIKVAITVEGGIVTGISSNKNIEIVVIDYDQINIGEKPIVNGILSPDTITENIYELFSDVSTPSEIEIRDELKRLKF